MATFTNFPARNVSEWSNSQQRTSRHSCLERIKTASMNLLSIVKRQLTKYPPYYNLKIILGVNKVCGTWPPTDKKYRRFYMIYSIFFLTFTLGSLLTAQTAFLLTVLGDAEKMASAFYMLLNNYVHCVKAFVVFRHQKRIQRLRDLAHSDRFACKDLTMFLKLKHRFTWSSSMHYAIFQAFGIFSCTAWISSSLFRLIKDGNDRQLPLISSYPYNVTITPIFQIQLFQQSVALVFCCAHNISIDGLVIGLMGVVCCEFEILKERVASIGKELRIESGIAENRKSENNRNEELKLCVQHHIQIIGYAQEVEDIFNVPIFLQFVENCLVICTTAFTISQLASYSFKTIAGNFIFLVAIIYQLFMYCYLGNEVSIKARATSRTDCTLCLWVTAIRKQTIIALRDVSRSHRATSDRLAFRLRFVDTMKSQEFVRMRNNYYARSSTIAANFHVKVSLNVMRYVGMWPPEDNYVCLYVLYATCSFAVLLGVFLTTETVNLIVVWGDLPKMVSGGFLLMTNLSHAYKGLNVLRQRKRIQRLLDFVESSMFSRDNIRCGFIVRDYTWRGIFHYAAYQTFSTAAVLCWGFTPLSDLIAGRERRLPLDGWYPYNITATPAFELICTHQFVALIICCFQNIALDTLVTGFIIIACCQLEILKFNVQKIGETNKKSNENALQKLYTNKSIEKDLNNCVEHHKAIIDFVKEVEDIFHSTIMLQFFVSSIIICLNALHVAQMRTYVAADLTGMALYTCSMTYQIFLYCWHGNELKLHSQSVMVAAFSGNWWLCGERFKRNLRLIMVRANRPLTLKAGKLLTLSLDTFVGILRASYSFFTVLQSTTNKTNI